MFNTKYVHCVQINEAMYILLLVIILEIVYSDRAISDLEK